MKKAGKFFAIATIIFLVMVVFASFAFADTKTTTMSWVVPKNKAHSIAYGGSCSTIAFFFVETNAAQDNDVDGNAAQMLPYNLKSAGGTVCQDGTSVAAMTITNSSNIPVNIDANFAAPGLDANVWLKVWMSNGAHCGTSGLGGWEKLCTYAAPGNTTSAVTTTQCRDFNSGNSTTNARLVTNMPVNDTNKLCFSGEFVGPVITVPSNKIAGDYNGIFQTTPDINGL